MAKATWLKIDPVSGSGNGTIDVSTDKYTGRLNRTTEFTVHSDYHLHTISVTQTGELLTGIDKGAISVDVKGGTYEITGKSNSSRLTFSIDRLGDAEPIVIDSPSTYIAGGVQVDNGNLVPDGLGEYQQYTYSVTLDIPANTDTFEKKCTLKVNNDSATHVPFIRITQAAQEAYLRVGQTSLTLSASGTPVTLSVESNTNWTVE